ncbi:flavin-containing monooxygenase [Brevibacterium jeotgali]|uniref:Putative flavoprotein involved in K+ transport n=1 Tax=Brevibacterium jeotgali TaxID=1262550 RepID=A0A2H1L8S1_9MICO|nr:putative flavoprotein involved in K+ transport [Brevibacterium jeotgali]SMY13287.1 putative flavoprotein involved in K+ transport [Brevibacterium jeotgali]
MAGRVTIYDVAIVGGGQAGLAAAVACQKFNLSYIVLEANDSPGGSWPYFYESLTLFSPAAFCALPGFRFPGWPLRFPHRDEMVSYLGQYVSYFGINLVTNHRVRRVDHYDGVYRLAVEGQKDLCARALISATGTFGSPSRPPLVGFEEFSGRLLHSAEYMNASTHVGESVAVVGAGNSAMQIAAELSDVASVSLFSREAPVFIRSKYLGLPVHFWFKYLPLDRLGLRGARNIRRPAIVDDGRYRSILQTGRVRWSRLPSVSDGVHLDSLKHDRHSLPDSVILATGFRPDTDWLNNLGVLSESGLPVHRSGIAQAVDTVVWVGLPGMRTRSSSMLRGVGADADFVVENLSNRLRDPTAGR